MTLFRYLRGTIKYKFSSVLPSIFQPPLILLINCTPEILMLISFTSHIIYHLTTGWIHYSMTQLDYGYDTKIPLHQ